jgi:hypothetical protein
MVTFSSIHAGHVKWEQGDVPIRMTLAEPASTGATLWSAAARSSSNIDKTHNNNNVIAGGDGGRG